MRVSGSAGIGGASRALRRREWLVVASVAAAGLGLAALAVLTPWSAAELTGRDTTGSVEEVVVSTVPSEGPLPSPGPARGASPPSAGRDAL